MSVPINLPTVFGQAPSPDLRRKGAADDAQSLGLPRINATSYRLASTRAARSDIARAAQAQSSATLSGMLSMTAKQRHEARMSEARADRPTVSDLLEEQLLGKHHDRVAKLAGDFDRDFTSQYERDASSRKLEESIAKMLRSGDPRLLEPAIQTVIANTPSLSSHYEALGLPVLDPPADIAASIEAMRDDMARAVSMATKGPKAPKAPRKRKATPPTPVTSPPTPSASEADEEPVASSSKPRSKKSPSLTKSIGRLALRRRKPPTD